MVHDESVLMDVCQMAEMMPNGSSTETLVWMAGSHFTQLSGIELVFFSFFVGSWEKCKIG